MTKTRWPHLLTGAVTSVLIFVLLASGGGARSAGTAVSVPDRLAGYSYLTGSVSQAPPGRALALYQHGFGVEFMDFPQAVILAADGDVYRRLDAAESRSGPESQADPAPMLLSPDGGSVALGDHDTDSADLELVDLGTGDISRYRLPGARSVLPVTWSPDGTRLAYLASENATDPYRGTPMVGRLCELDLASGDVELLPGGAKVSTAAYAPDGERLAVQQETANAIGVAIVHPDTGDVRALAHDGRLAGPHAWSPDGQMLTVSRASGIWAIELGDRPDGTGGSQPTRVSAVEPSVAEVLGWTADREVVVFDASGSDRTTVVAQAVDSRDRRELTRIDGTSNYGVHRMQLATALIADLKVRESGSADRGPLPLLLTALVALLSGVVVAVVAARIGRRSAQASPTGQGLGNS